jgi:hypothetical protein
MFPYIDKLDGITHIPSLADYPKILSFV